MKKRSIIIVLVALLVAAAGVTGYLIYERKESGRLTIYGNIDIRTVHLSFRVGGKLLELMVDEGAAVQPGQLLGRLDKQPYENSLKQAQASVLAQQAQLGKLEAGYRKEEIAQVRSELAERRTAFEYAEKFYQRQVNLLPSRAISTNDVDNARTARDQARAALQAAQDKLSQYETGSRVEDIDAARAALLQAQAALAQAELSLTDTNLIAPSAGTVLTRVVEPGTMLAAGSPVFTISLTRLVWVRAYVDGYNLSRAVPGRELEVYIDNRAAPYRGSIGFVSPTSEFTPKSVQTPELRTDLVYRLRILIEDADDALRQGMPVTIVFPDQD